MLRADFLMCQLAILAFAPAVAQEVPPPRGVNGTVLGTAEASRTPGPARVCFIQTGFDLGQGETAYLDYMGIHWASIRVIGLDGEFLIKEGNAWAEPQARGRAVADSRGRRIVRHREHGRPRYLIYGRVDGGPDRDRPLIWVEGPALTGTARDHAILDRIATLPENAHCQRRYVYGLFFDEPEAQ